MIERRGPTPLAEMVASLVRIEALDDHDARERALVLARELDAVGRMPPVDPRPFFANCLRVLSRELSTSGPGSAA